MRHYVLKCVLVLMLLPIASVFGREGTPIETFISRVKETNTFVDVSNIWRPDNNFDKSALLKNVEDAQPLIIDYSNLSTFVKDKKRAINLVIPGMNGKTYTLELARYDFVTNDFQVHEMGANNSDHLADYTPGVYYRGVVKGIPGSVAAFSFFNNEVYGLFSIPGEGNYNVVPNIMTGNEYDYNQNYLLFNDHDLKITDHAPGCATDKLPEVYINKGGKSTTTLNNNVYNNCAEVRCYEVIDNTMYIKKGSSTTNCTNYITALFNNKSTLYKNEGVIIVLRYLQINTTTDAYATVTTTGGDPSPFLTKFGQITQNTMHGCDVATLFSTRYSGTLGGVAWLMSMCASYNAAQAYGPYAFCDVTNTSSTTVTSFPTYSWDVEVATHEMGHVLGSPHTHRCCWNPPGTGTTAIDGCYTIEPSGTHTCGNPGNPSSSVGGTIMSYCHLTSSGTNFSNGFGQQPGDTIRRFLINYLHVSCGESYLPSIAVAQPNKTLAANRECTDLLSGSNYITYYWNDNNTADQTDDTLVLMVRKNGNNIGNMDQAGFSVSATTLTGEGGGTAQTATLPAGLSGVYKHNYFMRRYWKMTPTTAPTTAVEVMFPFLAKDTSDVNGSVPGTTAPLTNYKMYKVNSPVDPNPANNFSASTSSNFTIYTYGTSASTTNWSLSTSGTTQLAHMMMTNLSGGGTGFYTYKGVGIDDEQIANSGIYMYPNPANNDLTVATTGIEIEGIQITDVQGRTIKNISNSSNKSSITIQLFDVAAGLYFVQVQTADGVISRKVVVMK